MMTSDEIRAALNEMQISTARGRAELVGQAIDLGPRPYEVERAMRARADGYLEIYRRFTDLVQDQSAGIGADELEAVEWIRENMFKLVRGAHIRIAERG